MKKQTNNEIVGIICSELLLTGREGIENTIRFLRESDFFDAPASTKYHGAEEGGLARHSLNTMRIMEKLNKFQSTPFNDDSIVLVGLLHDACKIGVYKYKNKEYVKKDPFRIGHGEKSVIVLLETGLNLTEEEMIAIRYHMNMFDSTGYKDNKNWNNLSILCFIADYFASRFLDTQQRPVAHRKISKKQAKKEIRKFCSELRGKSFLEVTTAELVDALNIPVEQVKEIMEEIEK